MSAMIPKVFGSVKDISETYDEVEEFKEWVDSSEIRKETYKTKDIQLDVRNGNKIHFV